MATQVQTRRGTTAEHSTFTGAAGEVTVDTDKDVVVVHDGSTAGGFPQMRENGSQNLTTTGAISGARLIPTGSTVPTNGVYLPAANTVGVATNGAGRLFINSAGDVGLNTASPISIGVAGMPALTLASPTAGRSGGIYWANTGSTNIASAYWFGAEFQLGTQTAHPIKLTTNSTEKLRITSAGLVGIGESSPGSYSYSDLVIKGSTGGMSIVTGTSGIGRLVFADGIAGVGAYRGAIQYNHANDRLELAADGSTRAYLTSTGLGIGTQSPHGSAKLAVSNNNAETFEFQVGVTAGKNTLLSFSRSTSAWVEQNYVGSAHTFNISGSSNEKARIDSSGRLLVGTSTSTNNIRFNQNIAAVGGPAAPGGISLTSYGGASAGVRSILDIQKSRGSTDGSMTLVASGDLLGSINFRGADGSDFVNAAAIDAYVDGTPGANDMPGRLTFSTTADGASSPTERMRINKDGVITLNSTATGSAETTLSIQTGGTEKCRVRGDGDLENVNNAYGAISDLKLKENIADANSQWGDLKALQVRNYNFKPETGYGTHTQIGLVAQEAELVSPGLVTESPDRDEDGNDLGTVTKSVNYSVLYMKAVKALQEAMERIEVLEQRLNDAGIN